MEGERSGKEKRKKGIKKENFFRRKRRMLQKGGGIYQIKQQGSNITSVP